jgi:uncharacterized membrane protein YcaP (DUF421 family)
MELVIRVAIIYLFLLIALRIMGKRELGEMSAIELVTLMLIPEIVTESLKDEDYSIIGGIIGVCTLLVLVFTTSVVSYKFKKAGDVIEGTPTLLANHGKLIQENIDRERVSADEIFSEMHKQGYAHLHELRWVILEPDGKLAFIPHQHNEHQHGEEHHTA